MDDIFPSGGLRDYRYLVLICLMEGEGRLLLPPHSLHTPSTFHTHPCPPLRKPFRYVSNYQSVSRSLLPYHTFHLPHSHIYLFLIFILSSLSSSSLQVSSTMQKYSFTSFYFFCLPRTSSFKHYLVPIRPVTYKMMGKVAVQVGLC